MEEIWKDIEGYEGLYQVSNLGRVKSLARYQDNQGTPQFRPECIKKVQNNGNGYLWVLLYKNNKKQYYYLHRLVASTFISNPTNLSQVNHKDENKANNRVDNLEWCNQKYNCNYGTARERGSKNKRNHPKTSKPILQYDMDGNFIREWPSLREPHRHKIACSCAISRVCRGIEKQANGFIWRYK